MLGKLGIAEYSVGRNKRWIHEIEFCEFFFFLHKYAFISYCCSLHFYFIFFFWGEEGVG